MDSNLGILMPEVILYKTLKYIFKAIKDDFNSGQPEDETLLYHFFKKNQYNLDIEFETFNYYEQAKNVFITKQTQVNMGYNMEVSNMACVHILLPNENGNPFAIGGDENYQPNYNTTDPNDPNIENTQSVFSKRFDATYQLMVTSENTLEVLLVYNFIKACFISLLDHIELSGLRNPKFGGHDVQIQSDLVPTHIFHRSFTISFFYELNIPEFFKTRLIKDFQSTGIISSDNQNP